MNQEVDTRIIPGIVIVIDIITEICIGSKKAPFSNRNNIVSAQSQNFNVFVRSIRILNSDFPPTTITSSFA